jgi:signal transduction histidine kinase
VSLDLPPEPSRIALDGFLCERALVNLIDNAIDASRRGQTIMISARPGGESVMIRIKDHGSGMDRDTLDNVFLPFYTTKSEGTGVGMAITKKIIDEHGGTIRVQSQPGRGTEINIRLPYQ